MIARLVFPKWNLIANHARNGFTVSSSYMRAIADAPRNAARSLAPFPILLLLYSTPLSARVIVARCCRK